MQHSLDSQNQCNNIYCPNFKVRNVITNYVCFNALIKINSVSANFKSSTLKLQAPSAVAHKGETDKTQMKNMEMDKTKEMVGEDYKQ